MGEEQMRFEIKPANELSSSSLPLFLPFLWRFRSGQILIVEREERDGSLVHWFCFHVNASLCLSGDFGCRTDAMARGGGGGSCKSF